jgi:site-specific DNA-methyltransferase (adenine-specific)
MKNRNLDHSDNWATPTYFYDKLNEEFNFDFDPCPYNTGELDFDGTKIEWGKSNYINPPYSQKKKEEFVLKAIEEAKKGKLCVLLLPVSTSTKLFHDLIKPNAKEIRFVERRIKFIGINSKGEYVNWDYWKNCAPTGVKQVNNSGMHDSMIVILKN